MEKSAYSTALLLSLLLLAGCGASEHADITEWMQEQTQNMKGKVTTPPPLYTPPIVAYSATDRVSPFSMAKVNTREGGVVDKSGPGANHVAEYLESFPLESLKLIGVITYNDRVYALIQTPEKPKHVTVGGYIGQNYGKIVAITKNEVKIVETVKDANEMWVKKEKSLYLQGEGDKK